MRFVREFFLGLAALMGVVASPVVQAAAPVSIVDVLVLRTTGVTNAFGGTTFEEAVRRAFVNANIVLQNSQAELRFRLVGVTPLAYTASDWLTNDLRQLQTPGRPLNKQAAELREAANADLVCLVAPSGDIPFASAPGPSAANAFSVVRADALYDRLAVALSRNFGCQAERVAAAAQPALPFSFGLTFSVSNTVIGTIESSAETRLRVFSNPRLCFGPTPLGVPAGAVGGCDNTLTLNLVAPIVAAFRGPATRTLPPEVRLIAPTNGAGFTAGSRLTLQAQASDPDGRIVQVEFIVSGQSAGVVTQAPFEVQWEVPTNGDFTVQAVATDDQGATTATGLTEFTAGLNGPTVGSDVGAGLTGSTGNESYGGFEEWWVFPPPVLVICEPSNGITNVPPNDNFADRVALAGPTNTVTGWTANATAEPGEPPHAGQPAKASVWYAWTPTANGRARFWVNSKDNSPRLAIYQGESLAGLQPVGGLSVSCGLLTNWFAGPHWIEFPATAGVSYVLAVDSMNDGGGTFTLSFFFAAAPTNDSFADRLALSQPALQTDTVVNETLPEPVFSGTTNLLSGNTFAATKEPGEPNHADNPGGKSVWWSWTAPRNGRLLLDPAATSFPPLLAAYTGRSLPTLTLVASNNGSVEFPVVSGSSYALALDGVDGSSGDFSLLLQFFPSPFNDDFACARPRVASSFMLGGDTHAASSEPGEPVHGDPSNNGTLWWRWTAPASGDVSLTGSAAAGPLGLGAYVGNSLAQLWVATNGSGAVSFYAVRGVTYRIATAGPSELSNPFVGGLSGQPSPPALTCLASATPGLVILDITGLAGQSFALQVQTDEHQWQTRVVETLQAPEMRLPAASGDYRLVPLEELLLSAPLRLAALRSQDSPGMVLAVSGTPGQPFALQSSEDLVAWRDIRFVSVVGEATLLEDATATNSPQRFYRVRLP